MTDFMSRFVKTDESGVAIIEYGLIGTLLGVLAVTAVSQLGWQIGKSFDDLVRAMTDSKAS